jgi:rhamnogalacturonyl hydrolase YesR
MLAAMEKVADWELAQTNPPKAELDWTQGALYAGIMALSQVADDPKYHAAMIALGQRHAWNPGPRVYHADDHCASQTYLDLYFQDREPEMLAPTKARFDFILQNAKTNSLDIKAYGCDRWSWCDALFMAPPAWVRLTLATGEKKYLEFMDHEWWSTSDYLYDKSEHLYFRDSTYFNQRETNGQKIFWSRGNGWVMAGLVRILQVMPPDYPQRKRYEQQFKEMAARIAAIQPTEGLWHPSLLDPDACPMKEASGSGFYTYALA